MFQSFKSKLVFAFVFVGLSSAAQAAVWEDTNKWDSAWEDKYSEWVRTDFNEDFFTTGKWKGVPTDCADAVYYSRVIFAYENKLPFVILDHTGGSSKISNKMTRFDSTTDPVSRVRKFMYFLGDVVSTKTLPRDSYPVQVTRQYVRSGTIWSRPRITRDNIFRRIFGGSVQEDPGHAEIVKNVSEAGAVYLIGSTVPQEVRSLISTSSLVFMPIETSTGFRKWIQPEGYSVKVEELPGYSLEQFKMGERSDMNSEDTYGPRGGHGRRGRNLDDWIQQVQARLALREESKGETLQRYADSLCSLVKARVDIVKQAVAYNKRSGGQCMDPEAYDVFSTPSRDKRIRVGLSELVDLAGKFGFTTYQRMKSDAVRNAVANCTIEYAEGKSISLFDYLRKVADDAVSSDPNDSLEARWGLEAKSERRCPEPK